MDINGDFSRGGGQSLLKLACNVGYCVIEKSCEVDGRIRIRYAFIKNISKTDTI